MLATALPTRRALLAAWAASAVSAQPLGLLVACAHLLTGKPQLGEAFDAVVLVVVGVVFWHGSASLRGP